MKRSTVKTSIQLIIFLSLGFFFVWLSIRKLTMEQMQIIKESAMGIMNFTSILFIFISMLFGLLAHYVRALRNILLIEPLGYTVRKKTAFYSVMTCYLGNLAVPRLGEVLRCTFLTRCENIPFEKSFGTVVTERLFDAICWIPVFLTALFINTGILSEIVINKETGETVSILLTQKWNALISNHIIYWLAVGAILLVLALILSRKWWMKIKIFKQIAKIAKGLWNGVASIKDLKRPYLFLFYTLLMWIFYYLGTYLCFFAFDFLRDLGVIPAFSVLAFGTIGYIVAQGGLGAYPLLVAGVLLLSGVDYPEGLAAGWIGWGAQNVMILIVGFTCLILASFTKKTTIENKNSHFNCQLSS